jgi:predicted CoA-substrate-specific enzyme activase
MNDKCAAGTGRFLEVMANALNVGLDRIGTISLTSRDPCHISSTCTVFAESEVVMLRAQRKPVEDLVAGIHQAVAKRIAQLAGGMEWRDVIVFTGGVAKNRGMIRALEEIIGKKLTIPPEPQITGAIGAALIGIGESKKEKNQCCER